MKNFFELSYGTCSFIFPKRDVKFFCNYGIVVGEIELKDNKERCVGVVDKNYKQVLPLTCSKLVPKLNVMENGNFVFMAYNSETDEYEVMHFDIRNNQFNLKANDYTVIDNEVIQLCYDEYMALYNVNTLEVSTFYHNISPFVESKKYGCKVARAFFYIQDIDGTPINEVSTIINTKGEALENYYDLASGEEIASKDLSDVLVLERKNN